MPVFISHRSADDKIANEVYRRLKYRHNIECWIDDIDPQIANSRNSSKITSLILDRLDSCTNLLAIVTDNTKESWWVPFEIGVARRAPRAITTFTNLFSCQLPEYLNEWPVLKGNNAVDTFAKYYKQQKQMIKEAQRYSFSKSRVPVDSFHCMLKKALSQ
jgi:phosphoenolpyruvate carboxylase